MQFRAPLTVSLLLERYLDGPGVEPVVRFLGAGYREVVAATVNKLQFVAGYVVDGSLSWPARLELATAAHLYNNDETEIRLHHHLCVGRTAVALHDGTRRPVDPDGMQLSLANVVWSTYLRTRHAVTTRDLEVSWRSHRGPAPAPRSPTRPCTSGLTGQEDLGICTQPWGPRETWEQPTAAKLAFQAEQEREAAVALAQGRYSWVPPDQPRPLTYLDEPNGW